MKKNNDTYNPAELRNYIERWYDGTATSAEQNMLVEYFVTTSDADIPTDIRDEATVFRAIGMRRSSPDEALLAEIEVAIETEKTPTSRVGRMLRVSRGLYFAAAASIAAIIVVGIVNEPPVNLSVTSSDVVAVETTSLKNEIHLAVRTETTAEVKTEPARTKETPSANHKKNATSGIENDDIIYITDVDEATEVLAMVNAKLEKVEAETSKAIERSFEKAPDLSRELEKAPNIKAVINEACANLTRPVF